ncbi:3-oxoacyl-[acyl-carrier-protein] reductase [Carnobacterium divergens]|uniref:3-oxoacyl-[acyl-carrier-protein] reductase n=1 Tax=Carnobacterium divergens TaxID=2748 RepID=UPI000D401392|nr:3-oxoacyl-[acyl-carrier-protein] reductase [Carnobacterium divergens]MCO6018014.1 3-oxoacyl-[acyl-carrier-protein] reductase [Carnobacterium divergens]TFI61842.1 3-oxoacyl-[acyl-carrier-protein] reductase [Carnobacterium divergens]TFI89114.1 3-oxoacyl-[acyl-carrier-protein] reductase [Carnobacterium divergens]TFJ03267.1 3-oxoacyl-[acyl-carrier-protein] reductase [Carnobacterium divergens]TFJ05428.1 3-oxoacyl-[acyl-carrier-protein] reductase [Carnobacterium divergens]
MTLKDKAVIVTGSSRGIGKAIALEFAKKGYNIVLNGRKPIADIVVQEIEAEGVKCHCFIGDVSDFGCAKQLIDETKEVFGSVDILVNNAGITNDKLLMRMSEDDFDSILNVNLKGTFNTIRHASSVMLKQRSGTIINLSSVIGQIGNAGQANYAASKAGVIGLTKSAARELAARGITVNAIAPGFIETDMTDELSDKVKELSKQQIPLNRFGTVEDVAKAAVFLSENKYITGQVINIDGGMVMNG